MNDTKTSDAGLIDTLQTSNPKFEVGIDGVLYQYGNVYTLQRVGYFLHGKGVGHGARTYPKQVDTSFETSLNMGMSGHLGAHLHASFLLHLLQPCQTRFAHALEASGLGAGFPYTGTEKLYALL